MKAYLAAIFLFIITTPLLYALPVEEDTLRISKKEAEALFLNNNLDLIIQKLNIQQEEAQIIQAKLWPNPEFSVEEVNLWATKDQLSSGERLPPVVGNFGRNRQFAAALEQRIETAGKRGKRIALETVSRDIAAEYFSELIRNLKSDLRKNLSELSYHQSYLSVLIVQQQALGTLLASFEKQYASGNLNKQDLFRLKALKLELNQQIVESQKLVHAVQKELSVLLNLPSASYLVVEIPASSQTENLGMLTLDNLISAANTNRPDGKMKVLGESLARKKYDLEYAQRKPDITVGANYDRGGNFLLNFIGFGFKLDLPVFNRNQGAILESKIGIDKSKTETEQKLKAIEAEVTVTFRDLRTNLEAFRNLDPAYDTDLDQVFETYTSYFIQRRINMLEYLDFFDAYVSNKQTILLTKKQLWDSIEEMNFVTATEIN